MKKDYGIHSANSLHGDVACAGLAWLDGLLLVGFQSDAFRVAFHGPWGNRRVSAKLVAVSPQSFYCFLGFIAEGSV